MPDQRLSTLFTYTTFHIGLYATLTSGLFAVIAYANKDLSNALIPLLPYAKWTAVFVLIAGAAGGAIASNIPNFETFGSFSRRNLNIFGIPTFKYAYWAHIEHASFWIAVGIAAYAFLSFCGQPLHYDLASPSEIALGGIVVGFSLFGGIAQA